MPSLLGRERAIDVCRAAGGDRFAIYDVENREGMPVYVHAKVVIIDDVWAMVGSDNLNRRSWTHDSELSCAVLDETRDAREPRDPAGLGDGARVFARDLRLELWREHLDLAADGSQDADLLTAADAFQAVKGSAATLDDWYDRGCEGPRPPGRLRTHVPERVPPRTKVWAVPVSRLLYDPDGRAVRHRVLRRSYRRAKTDDRSGQDDRHDRTGLDADCPTSGATTRARSTATGATTRGRPGNLVRPLVHGAAYFAQLLEELRELGAGDQVYLADWRGDPDELLDGPGTAIGVELARAASAGALVHGLIWRSHLDRLRMSSAENRMLSEVVNNFGGRLLLDQRVRRVGSHHQKFVVIRHPDRPADDVAFVGGIDLSHSRNDTADHHGDPQTQPMATVYGPTPPWHDVQVEIRGPAVADVETCFRERWADPAPLRQLHPWMYVSDRIRGDREQASRLPDQLPAPPEAGPHTVQLLRTYPSHSPKYPFAPLGERSVALGYRKAIARAERLIYLEDQFLWSGEIAGVFADALRRSPELRLIAVVPRHCDQDGHSAVQSAGLTHREALRGHPRGRRRPGHDRRHREPRRHPGLRPRQGLRGRRHVGRRGLGQPQHALVDPRLRAHRHRRRRGLRPRPEAAAHGRAPRPLHGRRRRPRRPGLGRRRGYGRRRTPRRLVGPGPAGRPTGGPRPVASLPRRRAGHPPMGAGPEPRWSTTRTGGPFGWRRANRW